jgi:hypothetical protein
MKKSLYLFMLPGMLLPALLLSSCMQNWPQFRGPENNMVAKARNLPDV